MDQCGLRRLAATATRPVTTSAEFGRTSPQYTSAVPRRVALITGPTSGIGEGFARRYAADGYDVVLVSRDADRLTELAAELSDEGGRDVEVLPADLAEPAGRGKVAERLAAGVDVLVNNAGFGTSGEFWTADPAVLQAQLEVNVAAVMQLTRAALPAMIDAGAGTVLNVASVAGLLSGRGSTYSASKAWVVSFTEGLAVGLRGTGVGIHVVCPGYVHTQFHDRAGIDMTSLPSFMWLEVDDVVRESLADIARGRVVIVPGVQYKAITSASRMVPRTLARAATSVFGRGRGRT
jgi:short-subunit dehydrogenase